MFEAPWNDERQLKLVFTGGFALTLAAVPQMRQPHLLHVHHMLRLTATHRDGFDGTFKDRNHQKKDENWAVLVSAQEAFLI
jgi:hypothetical protein